MVAFPEPIAPVRVHRKFSISKADGVPNEDSVRHSDRMGVYAVSDGASISYDSLSWSSILATRYVKEPVITKEWLQACAADFNRLHDRDTLPWMKQAAFDRGSFASLLGVRHDIGRNVLQIDAVGDSLAVLCNGTQVVSTFPYGLAEQFNQSPLLLSSNPFANPFLTDKGLGEELSLSWDLSGLTNPILLCMTDALGHWLLSRASEMQSAVTTLLDIRKKRQFSRFVIEERKAHRLRRDDTTLLALW